jgi:hypothetical protein
MKNQPITKMSNDCATIAQKCATNEQEFRTTLLSINTNTLK